MSHFIRAGRLLAGSRTLLRQRTGQPASRRTGQPASRRPGTGSHTGAGQHPGATQHTAASRGGARRLALAVIAPALAVAAAGCAGAGQASVRLPPKTVIRSPAPAQVADRLSPRQQVLAAYAGYWQASGDAVNAGNARLARRILARYVPASAIPGMIATLRQDWDTHAVADGNPVLHILSVQVRKGRATVHDCVDLSQAGLKNARTGLALPHSFGSPRANYYASLVLQGGRWLVSNIVPVVAPCDS